MDQDSNALFHELVDCSPAERQARYAERNVPAQVRKEVESMFRSPLTTAVAAPGAMAAAAKQALKYVPIGPGGQCGPYRLIRLIGHGGMGDVYEAEQDSPRRTVALKVIRAGTDNPDVRRFAQESQALARLQHPGIAQIYGAGTAETPTGPQPYFAMEFIRGRALTEYCNARRLDTRARLELMTQICDAVHHAHQRGIIHRDLKPANILVDETGQPKILDFGVARMTDNDAQLSLRTDVGQLVGTLAYMSPEQVLADPLELDTRTDVYSLGVILYELLAGRLPYDIDRKHIEKSARAIREEDPASLGTLNRVYRGDVETIVGKALEKEKGRRYSSAADLAADIRRYLRDEPVIARPPSTVYQLQKFARRHRGLVAGVAAVFVALIAGVIVSAWQAARARRAERVAVERLDRATAAEQLATTERNQARLERDRAEAAEQTAATERDRATTERNKAVAAESQAIQDRSRAIAEKRRADDEAATARAVSDFLQTDLLAQASASNQARPDTRPDPDLKVRTALDRAAARIGTQFEKQPLVEAAIRQTIANTYQDLGLYAQAQPQLERAIELRRKLQGEDRPETLDALRDLADLYWSQGKLTEAQTLQTKVLETLRRVMGEEHSATLSSMSNLARMYEVQGQFGQAEAYHAKVLELSRRMLGEEHSDTLDAMTGLALVKVRNDRFAEAEALDARAMEIMTRKLGAEHPRTLTAMNDLAQVYWAEGKYEQAEKLQARTLESRRRVLGESHPETLVSMNNLALIYKGEQKLPEAEAILFSTLEIKRRVLGEEHPDTLISMNNLASSYEARGKYPEAETTLAKTLEIKRRVLGMENPSTFNTMYILGRVYSEQSKYGQAEPLYKELLEVLRRALGPQHPNTIDTMTSLAEVQIREGRYADAEAVLREALPALEKITPNGWKRFYGQSLLAASLTGLKRYAEAEPLLLSGYDGLLQRKATLPIASKDSPTKAGEWAVQLYTAWNRPDKADEWRARVDKEKADATR